MENQVETKTGQKKTKKLPTPLAVELAKNKKPIKTADGIIMGGATADDEVSGMATYTDDPC